MCAYKHSPEALASAKEIIRFKIERESIFLQHYAHSPFVVDFDQVRSVRDLLLVEGRAAHHFWRAYAEILPKWCGFAGRSPGGTDITNRLLDIGFHHLTNIIRALLEKHGISPALALLHVPRASDSAPLAYDLVELFRADSVDVEVARYLRLKKKPFNSLHQEVPHFVHELKERLDALHYLKDFHQCHSYRYYMELQTLKFVKAVNHKEIVHFLTLPTRHDTRCLTHGKAVLP